MPQLDPSVFSPQIIWLIISFVALYLIMAKSALPLVSNVLEERRDQISDDFEHAKDLNADSVNIEAQYERSLDEAKLASKNSIQNSKNTLKKKMDDAQALADSRIATKLSKAESRIIKAKAEAMKNLEDIAVDTTREVFSKLTGTYLAENDARSHVRAEVKAVTEKGV